MDNMSSDEELSSPRHTPLSDTTNTAAGAGTSTNPAKRGPDSRPEPTSAVKEQEDARRRRAMSTPTSSSK
jgi:hypothetical protein